jgi:two-component system LytT family response regulator
MQKRFKTLIVDDESLLRDYLRDLLKKFSSVEVVGEADSVSTAVTAIQRHHPDLIFLDIKFPGETGFDLFEKIAVKAKVVFVTAFDEYAIRAFEVNAQDYLLKPINPDRLALTLKRIESAQETRTTKAKHLQYNGVIFIELNNRFHFIKVDTILRITAAGFYTELLTTTGKKGLVQRTMKEWEANLPEENFARIHRSTIVNVEYVDRIERGFNNTYQVHLKGSTKPEAMSRRYVARIKSRLGG